MNLIILITEKTQNGLEIGQAWRDAGAPGVTIIPGHGLFKLESKVRESFGELVDKMGSAILAMTAVIQGIPETAVMLITVAPDEKVDAIVNASSNIIGDLFEEHTGVLFVLDVKYAHGIRGTKPN